MSPAAFSAFAASSPGSRSSWSAGGADAHVPIANWFTSGKLVAAWALRIDTLTAVMLVVVTTVSFVVHVYSIGYMSDDPSRPRFFAYLSLFTFAMLMLVTADNLVQLFFGWEGVGLMSYLLIGFWYERPSANAAAIKAFVVNRVGDFGFSLGIFLTYYLTGSIAFDQVFAAAPGLAGKTVHFIGFNWDAVTLACLLLFMGAMGKSAQFLLHTWLPDAMEGPTPVSALIHAATMVTAGVFMVAQTLAAIRNVAGCAQRRHHCRRDDGLLRRHRWSRAERHQESDRLFDLLAARLHVCRPRSRRLQPRHFPPLHPRFLQGAAVPRRGLRHHRDASRAGHARDGRAAEGDPVHVLDDDDRNAFADRRRHSAHAARLCRLRFQGRDHRGAHSRRIATARMYGFLCTDIAAGLTAFYSWRLMFMTFFGQRGDWAESLPRRAWRSRHDGDHSHGDHPAHESPLVMLVPARSVGGRRDFRRNGFPLSLHRRRLRVVLAPFAVPWTGEPYSRGYGARALALVSLSPSLFMLGGLLVAYYMYLVDRTAPQRLAAEFPALYRFLLNKWYFDELYDFIFVRPAFAIGRLFWKGGDGVIIDGFGPDGVSARVLDVARSAVRLQTGYVYHYAFAMLLGAAALTTWYLFGGVPQ